MAGAMEKFLMVVRILTNVTFDINTRTERFTAFIKLIPPH